MHHLKFIPILAALLLSSTLMSQTSDSLDLVLKRAAEAGLIQEKDIEDIRRTESIRSSVSEGPFPIKFPEDALLLWLMDNIPLDQKDEFTNAQTEIYIAQLKKAGLMSALVEHKWQNAILKDSVALGRRTILSRIFTFRGIENLFYGPPFQTFLNDFAQKYPINQAGFDRLQSKIKQHEDLTGDDLLDFLPMPAVRLPTDETDEAIEGYYRQLAALIPEIKNADISVVKRTESLVFGFKILDKQYEQTISLHKSEIVRYPGQQFLQSIYVNLPFAAFNDALAALGSDKRLVYVSSAAALFWTKQQPCHALLISAPAFNALQQTPEHIEKKPGFLFFFPQQFPQTPTPYNDWIKKWQQNNLITSEEAQEADIILAEFEATSLQTSMSVPKELAALAYVKSVDFYLQEPDKSMPIESFKQAATEYFQKLVTSGIVSETLREAFVTQTSKGISNNEQFPPDLWTLSWILSYTVNKQAVQSTDIQTLVETAKQRRIFSPQCTPPDLMSLTSFLQNGLNPSLRQYQAPFLKSVSDASVIRQAVTQFFDTIRVWFPVAQISNLQFASKKEETQAGIIHQTIFWLQSGELQKMEYEESADWDLATSFIFEELWHIISIHAKPGSLKTPGAAGQPLVPIELLEEYTSNAVPAAGFTMVLVPEQDAIWLETQREVL
ncbi:MAG: hypothetical protein WCR52_23935, partial [Bacteroidota bacterium]